MYVSAAGTANASSVRLGRLHAKSEDEKEALTAPLKSTSDQAAAFMMSATAFLKVPGSHGLHEYYSGLAPMSQNVMALQAYKVDSGSLFYFCISFSLVMHLGNLHFDLSLR
jgi:hypothetical protein